MTDEIMNNESDSVADEAVTAEEKISASTEEFTQESPQALDLLNTLREENIELKDQCLRLSAEMENLRRRTEREIKDARNYSIAGFARDMLGVSDNLRRALDNISTEPCNESGRVKLIEGVEMTERSMLSALERHGIRKLEPMGQKFDPNFHQAMFEVPNSEVPNNTIVQMVQAGFSIGERVLRPAMVGVAKGGPKVVEPENSYLDQKDA